MLAFPTRSPGSRCGAGAPASEPAEKFRRCKREKTQLSSTPARTRPAAPPPQPDPWRPRPWPPRALPRAGGGAAPPASLGPPGAAATSPEPSARRQEPPPGPSPAPARLSAPLGSWGRARAPLTPPRRAGARAGCVGYIGLGGASPARRAVALGDFCRHETLGASRSSRSSPPPTPTPSFSLVSRLFFPG